MKPFAFSGKSWVGCPAIYTRIAAFIVLPATIAGAGRTASRRFLEFCAATICIKEYPYGQLSGRLPVFRMVHQHRMGGIDDIEPLHVSAYIEATLARNEKLSVEQPLVAIRMLFALQVIAR